MLINDGFNAVIDADGNSYNIVKIGNQVWMSENLKATRYNDGTAIPFVKDKMAWSNLTTPGFCWYNNDECTYKKELGALYNWYTVNTGKLCPAGWHVPSEAEWSALAEYLGGKSIAGGKLKETGTVHWKNTNARATNERGFTALPGGHRSSSGEFGFIGDGGYWWSATDTSAGTAWYIRMFYSTGEVIHSKYYYYLKKLGMSVRCLRD